MWASEFGPRHRAVEVQLGGIFAQGSIVRGTVFTVHMVEGDHEDVRCVGWLN